MTDRNGNGGQNNGMSRPVLPMETALLVCLRVDLEKMSQIRQDTEADIFTEMVQSQTLE